MNKDYRTEMLDRLSVKKPEVAKIRYTEGYNAAILVARSIIATTLPKGVELAPVIRARWEFISGSTARCTNCKEERDVNTQHNWSYCPNCGAEMEEIEQ